MTDSDREICLAHLRQPIVLESIRLSLYLSGVTGHTEDLAILVLCMDSEEGLKTAAAVLGLSEEKLRKSIGLCKFSNAVVRRTAVQKAFDDIAGPAAGELRAITGIPLLMIGFTAKVVLLSWPDLEKN